MMTPFTRTFSPMMWRQSPPLVSALRDRGQRPLATHGAKLAGPPSGAYTRLASARPAVLGVTQAIPSAGRRAHHASPEDILALVQRSFKLIPVLDMIDLWSKAIDDLEAAPLAHTQARLQYTFRQDPHHQAALHDLDLASHWLAKRPSRLEYRESQGATHLHSYLSRTLGARHMPVKEQYVCMDPGFFGPSDMGRADLGGHLERRPVAAGAHCTAFLLELKTPQGLDAQSQALIQVIMYAQSESLLATLRHHAHPGVTPWVLLGIGAGWGNLHVFGVSLSVLEAFRAHRQRCEDPPERLPMLAFTMPRGEKAGEVEAEQVLRDESVLNPYTSSEGLLNFVQIMSFGGRPVSEWAGVGERARLLVSTIESSRLR